MNAVTIYSESTVITVSCLGYQTCKQAAEMFSWGESHTAIGDRLGLDVGDTRAAIDAGRICKTVYQSLIINPAHGLSPSNYTAVLKAHCVLNAL